MSHKDWGREKIEKKSLLRIMLSTEESGLWERISDRVKEFKYGLMVLCMKDGGEITRLMERVD